jgi:DNA-binding MarR family transcriptional regulator
VLLSAGVQDRRAFHVHLTATGHTAVTRVNEVIPDLDAELGKTLKSAQRRQLAGHLKLIAQALGLKPAVHPYLSSRQR